MISHVTKFINLNDKEFIIHPQPQQNELLSSWLVRVARANNVATTSFTNMHFKEYQKNILWQRDLDIWCPESLLEKLSHKSHLSKHQIFDMTLKSYEGKLRHKIHGKNRTHFIQSLGNYAHIKRNGGLRFCPLCLANDSIPYFRKEWRLSFYTACLEHKCFLLNRCPNCNSPLTLSKSYQEKDFTFCYKCGIDLKKINIIQEDCELEAIIALMNVLNNGYGNKLGQAVPSIEYFDFLKQINKMIYLWENTREISEQILFSKPRVKNGGYEDYMSIKEQHILYLASNHLVLSHYAFFQFIEANHILNCYIYKDIFGKKKLEKY